MHYSSEKTVRAFFETYCSHHVADEDRILIEVGCASINGSLRDLTPAGHRYLGLDLSEHETVDVVMDDPDRIPLANDSADVIVCSSVFEHCSAFWVLFTECIRVLKPEGLLYINAPSNGFVHRYPIDAWRFYPDAGIALAEWGRKQGFSVTLVESFIGRQSREIGLEGWWSDFVAVFIKADTAEALGNRRIVTKHPDLEFIAKDKMTQVEMNRIENEDQQISAMQYQKLLGSESELESFRAELKQSQSQTVKLQRKLAEAESALESFRAELEQSQSETVKLQQKLQSQEVELMAVTRSSTKLLTSVNAMSRHAEKVLASKKWRLARWCFLQADGVLGRAHTISGQEPER